VVDLLARLKKCSVEDGPEMDDHPSKKNQRIAARQNWTIAISNRPWSNCPRPGIKKLQSAARTLPAEPWPAMLPTL
jgi:hypothetical protein